MSCQLLHLRHNVARIDFAATDPVSGVTCVECWGAPGCFSDHVPANGSCAGGFSEDLVSDASARFGTICTDVGAFEDAQVECASDDACQTVHTAATCDQVGADPNADGIQWSVCSGGSIPDADGVYWSGWMLDTSYPNEHPLACGVQELFQSEEIASIACAQCGVPMFTVAVRAYALALQQMI